MERGSFTDRSYDADPVEPASSGDVETPIAAEPSARPAAVVPADAVAPVEPVVAATGLRERLAARVGRSNAWWALAGDNLRGSILMLTSFLAFAIMTAAMKGIGTRVPLPQILLLRQALMTVLLLPLFLPDIGGVLRTDRPWFQILRGVFSLLSMLLGFTAIFHVPLADATALGFSQVLFVTVLAVVVLKERVGWRRWAATLIGFVGVVVMLRPTAGGLSDPYGLLSVAAAAFGSIITVMVRLYARSEKTATILIYQALVLIAALALPTIVWWVPPTPWEWFLIGLVGVFGTAGQYLITRAYQTGEAAALAPLDFVRLLIATAIGFTLFAEVPSLSTLVGATIVIGATVYTMQANVRSRRP